MNVFLKIWRMKPCCPSATDSLPAGCATELSYCTAGGWCSRAATGSCSGKRMENTLDYGKCRHNITVRIPFPGDMYILHLAVIHCVMVYACMLEFYQFTFQSCRFRNVIDILSSCGIIQIQEIASLSSGVLRIRGLFCTRAPQGNMSAGADRCPARE